MRLAGVFSLNETVCCFIIWFDALSCAEAAKLKKQAIKAVSLIVAMVVCFDETNLWRRKGDQNRELMIAYSGFMFDCFGNQSRDFLIY
jgi:hypothetical protein